MIQYLSDLLKNSLNEIIIQLGLSDVLVETLVRGGLILLLLTIMKKFILYRLNILNIWFKGESYHA